ncbi:hypothetical protein [Mesomycoplasma neurolyticum]|uniref:Uncharacterized protein n=1 Tax=Mesomycoplasma neurolyticum TaxID=2120 RepID=A0A449A6I6_9BACT|nr:hypothetical protein [Mesomycoplasma neurolyticum]VEU59839.1 Uncharacterised protein [Mesomycoplasma neurolyticum]
MFLRNINFSETKKEKWIYIILWILFSFLLLTVILLLTLYKKTDISPIDQENFTIYNFLLEEKALKIAKDFYQEVKDSIMLKESIDAANALRANIIASFSFIFVLVFFAAIVSTVVVNKWFLNNSKLSTNKRGVK